MSRSKRKTNFRSSDESIINCQHCEEVFENKEDLKSHMDSTEAFLKVFCKNCETFLRLEESNYHLEVTQSCSLCKLVLRPNNYLTHKCFHEESAQTMAKNLKIECNICDKAFFSYNDIDNHIKDKHSDSIISFCRCCNLDFRNEVGFDEHFEIIHGKVLTKIDGVEEKIIRKKCCSQCPLKFDTKKDYLAHKRRAHEVFLCYICGKKMHTHFIRTHLDIHENNRRYQCTKCDKKFRLPQTLRNHQSVHSDESNFQCQTCGKGFKKAYNLKVHLRIHAPVKPFECAVCGKQFTTKQSRDNHLKTHKLLNGSPKTESDCPYCEKSFLNIKEHTENLAAFLKVRCENCDNSIRNDESHLHSDVKYSCYLCHTNLEEVEFISHRCFHEGDWQDSARKLKVRCETCSKIYFSLDDMREHLKLWHSGTYFCQCCNFHFKNEKKFNAHVKSTHRKKKNTKKKEKIKTSKEKSDKKKCTQCPLMFDNKKDYLAHKRRAHEIFLCYICGKKMHINFMRTHIDMHENYKRFKCKFCDKRFRLPGTVRNHQMIHSNEANYQCQMCGKGFKKAYNLKVHMRIHSPVKPFECVICKKTFTTKQSRDNHLKTHK